MGIVNRLVGSSEDAKQMDRVQGAVITALGQFRDNTEAIVIAGALLRVARMLIRLYGPKLRTGFVDASTQYLRGHSTMPDARENDLRALGFKAPDGGGVH
jgi:hypothetical protein